MPGISAARARVLEKLEVEPFRSKTLLPGSMPGISEGARARPAEAKRYFRKDLCPGFPQRAPFAEARSRAV